MTDTSTAEATTETRAARRDRDQTALNLLGLIDHDTLTAPMRPLTDEQKALIPDLLKTVTR